MPQSSTPLTDEELAEIRERLADVPPGPWGTYRDLAGEYTVQARPRITSAGTVTDGDVALVHGGGWAQQYHTAAFIAHARTDVPALLAEVDRLRARVAALAGPGSTHSSRADVLREAQDATVEWLTKRAREEQAAARQEDERRATARARQRRDRADLISQLADKVSRGAVRSAPDTPERGEGRG